MLTVALWADRAQPETTANEHMTSGGGANIECTAATLARRLASRTLVCETSLNAVQLLDGGCFPLFDGDRGDQLPGASVVVALVTSVDEPIGSRSSSSSSSSSDGDDIRHHHQHHQHHYHHYMDTSTTSTVDYRTADFVDADVSTSALGSTVSLSLDDDGVLSPSTATPSSPNGATNKLARANAPSSSSTSPALAQSCATALLPTRRRATTFRRGAGAAAAVQSAAVLRERTTMRTLQAADSTMARAQRTSHLFVVVLALLLAAQCVQLVAVAA